MTATNLEEVLYTQWPKSVDESKFVGTACNSSFSAQNM